MRYPKKEHIVPLPSPFNLYGQDKFGGPVLSMSVIEIEDQLRAIKRYHGLVTYWKVFGIDQRYMDQPVPFPVRTVIVGDTAVTLPFEDELVQPLTWFDLWSACDAAAKLTISLQQRHDLRDSAIVGFNLQRDDIFIVDIEPVIE